MVTMERASDILWWSSSKGGGGSSLLNFFKPADLHEAARNGDNAKPISQSGINEDRCCALRKHQVTPESSTAVSHGNARLVIGVMSCKQIRAIISKAASIIIKVMAY